MKRLFVGLNVPEEISSTLASMQFGVRGARWISPEYFHLTLCFIGEVNNRVVDDTVEILEGIDQNSFSLKLMGVNHFATKGRMRSLWVGIEKNPTLLSLQKKISSALVGNNVPADRREFNPHVTVAKLRNTSIEDISRYEQENNLFKSNSFTVTYYTVFESYLKRSAPIYTTLKEIPLIE